MGGSIKMRNRNVKESKLIVILNKNLNMLRINSKEEILFGNYETRLYTSTDRQILEIEFYGGRAGLRRDMLAGNLEASRAVKLHKVKISRKDKSCLSISCPEYADVAIISL